jgi:hypothetical protein
VLAIVYKKCYTEKSFGCQEIWGKSYFEIGALRNFMHFGGHLKNGCQNDRHFEIALVTITFL